MQEKNSLQNFVFVRMNWGLFGDMHIKSAAHTGYFVTQQFVALMTHIPLCNHLQYCYIDSSHFTNFSRSTCIWKTQVDPLILLEKE